MTQYVHRNGGAGTPISYAGPQQPGYADEALADTDAELVAFLAAAQTKPHPTPREWLERLAPATQLALETAALTKADVALWLRKATGNPTIDVTLQETKDGVAAMVTAGLLTAADQTTLLTP